MHTLDLTRDVGQSSTVERAPFLFLVLECHRPLAAPMRFALARTLELKVRRGEARDVDERPGPGGRRVTLSVADSWMSNEHATFARVPGGWVLRDGGSRNGTFLNGARVTEGPLADGDRVEVGKTIFVFRAGLPAEVGTGDLQADAASDRPAGMISLVPSVDELHRRLAGVAETGVSIVLTGETGTGKEVLARAVHQLSRRPGDLVAVNCGALPATLLESELYGHVKGAFSGATQDRVGLVRAAHRGTLFLDEIGDLPLASQVAFLRVLQEREVVPVGASRPVPVDLRLISASHMDVEAMTHDGARFRADLWARISGLRVELVPLRDRREDLGLLIGTLLRRLAEDRAEAIRFQVKAVRALLAHDWPLNVRELEKTLGTALALATDGTIGLTHLPPAFSEAPDAPAAPAAAASPAAEEAEDTLPFSEADLETRAQLIRHLEEHRGSIAAVARAMGKARIQIQRWVKRFEIDVASYKR